MVASFSPAKIGVRGHNQIIKWKAHLMVASFSLAKIGVRAHSQIIKWKAPSMVCRFFPSGKGCGWGYQILRCRVGVRPAGNIVFLLIYGPRVLHQYLRLKNHLHIRMFSIFFADIFSILSFCIILGMRFVGNVSKMYKKRAVGCIGQLRVRVWGLPSHSHFCSEPLEPHFLILFCRRPSETGHSDPFGELGGQEQPMSAQGQLQVELQKKVFSHISFCSWSKMRVKCQGRKRGDRYHGTACSEGPMTLRAFDTKLAKGPQCTIWGPVLKPIGAASTPQMLFFCFCFCGEGAGSHMKNTGGHRDLHTSGDGRGAFARLSAHRHTCPRHTAVKKVIPISEPLSP